MFGFYTSSDESQVRDEIAAAVRKGQEVIPADRLVFSLICQATEMARQIDWSRVKYACRSDYVNSAETLAGVIDHNEPKLQCRGQTSLHDAVEEANSDIKILIAELKKNGIPLPEGLKRAHFIDFGYSDDGDEL